jgi:hypothetical protein
MCLFRAYVVARDTRAIRPENRHPETGQENRMPLFCAMVQRFAEECRQGSWLGISQQQMVEDIATDACLAGWWNEHHFLAGIPTEVVSDNRAEDQVPQTQRMISHFERRKRLSQTDEQREERAAYAHRMLKYLSRMAVPIQGAVVLWEHLTCGCPVYYQRNGREVCACCFPDPAWSENALKLIHSIVEQNGAEDTGSEATEDTLRSAPETIEILAKEEQQSYEEAASGWIEREEAYACAAHLLDELARNGYAVEVYLHLAGEQYQVIVKGADGELICETAEQVGYLIEQAQKGLL